MAYSIQTDIENRIGSARLLQLADRDGNGSVDAAVLAAAIEKADDLIDSYLRGRYDLPLQAPVPVIVRELSVDLSIYFLQQARRETLSNQDQQNYQLAIDFLEGISLGTNGIDLGNGAENLADKNLPEVTTPLATHDPVYRKDHGGHSSLDGF